MTGIRSGDIALIIFSYRHCERSEAIPKPKAELDCFVAALLAMTGSFRHQRVDVLDRLGKILLEFLHHGGCRFHAIDQSDALADEIADQVARLRVARGSR